MASEEPARAMDESGEPEEEAWQRLLRLHPNITVVEDETEDWFIKPDRARELLAPHLARPSSLDTPTDPPDLLFNIARSLNNLHHFASFLEFRIEDTRAKDFAKAAKHARAMAGKQEAFARVGFASQGSARDLRRLVELLERAEDMTRPGTSWSTGRNIVPALASIHIDLDGAFRRPPASAPSPPPSGSWWTHCAP